MAPKSLSQIYENSIYEAITLPVPDQSSGTFLFENIDQIINEIEWADTVFFGPGLQNDTIAVEWMAEVLKKINKPMILDASGFQPLIDNKLKIHDLPDETILTPHYAEFSRIFKMDIQDVINDPIASVKKIIPNLNGRILILKGRCNITVTSESQLLLMNHGTNALATAGTGDILTGLLASGAAQGLDMNETAVYSTYLHAECAHQYSQKISGKGLTAHDIIKMLPYAQDALYDIS